MRPRRYLKGLSRSTKALERLLETSRERLTEDEIHDLRTGFRRVRIALKLARGSKAGVRGLDSRLHEAGDRLGAARDLDVVLRNARRLRVPAAILERLARRRKAAHAAAQRSLPRARRAELAGELRKVGRRIGRRKPRKLRAGLARLEGRLERWRARPPRSPRELHALRVDIRQARYAIELFGRDAGRLKTFQDVVGHLHDLAVLARLAGRNGTLERRRKTAERRSFALVGPALKFALSRLQSL